MDSRLDSELYLRILNQMPNPIWRSGKDGKCDFFNKAWLAFTGRSMAQELGDGWAEGVHPDDLKSIVDKYYKSFKLQEPFELEYRLKHADGTYHWILDYGQPFFGGGGEFMGYVGSCYDITDRKNYIESIEKLNSLMFGRELKVAELKRELEELSKKLKGISA